MQTASPQMFVSIPYCIIILIILPLGTLGISQILMSAGFILAGFSPKLWQLSITQGIMVGVGIGLSYMATQPLISQWFSRRRALAMGLTSAGVGAGGLIFSITTRLALANLGIRYAYIINGVIVFILLTPPTFLLKCSFTSTFLFTSDLTTMCSSRQSPESEIQDCPVWNA